MGLSPEPETAFNAQITMEFATAYWYLGMSDTVANNLHLEVLQQPRRLIGRRCRE